MSRPLRIDIEGAWYHVTARGHNRRNIFWDEGDRRHYLGLVKEMTVRYRVEIHAYVLMDNHYHLLVRTPEANLSRAIQWRLLDWGSARRKRRLNGWDGRSPHLKS